MFGVFFYVSVCSVEAPLASSEIIFFFFVNINRRDITVVWSVTKALVFRLTAFLGIHLLWEYTL